MGRIEVAADQQESELSMLRYLVWAIPSIGFIGTVRGIGVALQRADEALTGDISGVTSALGVAFNSTLVALIYQHPFDALHPPPPSRPRRPHSSPSDLLPRADSRPPFREGAESDDLGSTSLIETESSSETSARRELRPPNFPND